MAVKAITHYPSGYMDTISRSKIASYEYANYQSFKSALLSELAVKDVPLPAASGVISTAAFAEVNLSTIIQSINPRELLQNIIDAGDGRISNQSPLTERDIALGRAIEQMAALEAWAQTHRDAAVSGRELIMLQNAVAVLKSPNVQNWQIQQLLIPYVQKNVGDEFTKVMNQNKEELGRVFAGNAVNAALKNGQFGNLRGSVETGPSKIIKSRYSTSPLLDLRLEIDANAARGRAVLDVDIKATTQGLRAKRVEILDATWDDIVAGAMRSLSSRTYWGLMRQFDYTVRIDKEVQSAIVKKYLSESLGLTRGRDGGIESVNYFVHVSKWYPMSEVIRVILERYDQAVRIRGQLTGFGSSFEANDMRRFAMLGTPRSVQERATVTWTNVKSMRFGELKLTFDVRVLN